MSLKDVIEAKMDLKAQIDEKIRHQKAMEVDAEETRKLIEGGNPTIGMSTAEKLGAGFQSGLRNVGRNIGNMVGLYDDEDLAADKKREAPLGDTAAGAVGQFAGETAALLPLGAAAGGAVAKTATALPKLAGALPKAKGATTAISRLIKAGGGSRVAAAGAGARGAATAATDSALAGAILSAPGERGEGALTAATTGVILNKTLGAVGRKFARGLKESPEAQRFGDLVEKELGRRPKLPVAQSANSPAARYPHKSVLSMFPLARGGSKKMEAESAMDWTKAVLMRGFGKKVGKEAIEELEKTDDVVAAIKKGLEIGKKGAYPQNRKALEELVSRLKAGEMLTPNKLDAAALKVAKGDQRPFYDLTSAFAKIMDEPLEESTVSGRRLYNKMMNKVVPAGFGAALSGGAIPYLALTGGTRALTSAPAQNFLMGRTVVNKGADKLGRALSPYGAAIRSRIAAGDS